MPIKSTSPISAFSPGLAKKAVTICLLSTTAISAHSTRNTSIRTRKIRGGASFVNSSSIVERGEGGISGFIPCKQRQFFHAPNMAQRAREKRPLAADREQECEFP